MAQLYLAHSRRILGEIDDLAQLLGTAKVTPKGLLHVNATLGFGRSHVAPVISRFVRKYPQERDNYVAYHNRQQYIPKGNKRKTKTASTR